MPIAERNEVLDEAIRVWKDVWSGEPIAVTARSVNSPEIVLRPRPIQLPHPPIWIGGNCARARQRVADYGSGWTRALGGEVLARPTRPAPIPDVATLGRCVQVERIRTYEAAGLDELLLLPDLERDEDTEGFSRKVLPHL